MSEQDWIAQLQAQVEPILRQVAIWTRREFFLAGALLLALVLLKKKQRTAAAFSVLAGWTWMAFHDSVTEYFHSLGSDSFAEAQNFDWHEAMFWFTTLREVVTPDWSLGNFVPVVAVALAAFWGMQTVSGRRHSGGEIDYRLPVVVASVAICIAVLRVVGVTTGFYLSNSNSFSSLKKNFDTPVPGIAGTGNDIKIVVYIGESTSVMNMSVYGYGRNTTPNLKRLHEEADNLLVFHDVFSTHTHTSFSLLEALSFAVDTRENYLPINARRRLSIIDVLQSNGIPTALISNQGKAGTWNQASSIIFKNASRTFSIRSELAGSRDVALKRPWDHEFFLQQVQPAGAGLSLPARVTFLHSYAGHGKYFENIPPAYRLPVDRQYEGIAPALLFGFSGNHLKDLEQYDAAVKYIDESLCKIIELVRRSVQPIVLVYFSDHGESIYTGRGHESSRFTHEMARVPLVMYFNDAARRAHEELFQKYSGLSRSANSSTLAQVPSTLLDLLGARIEPRDAAKLIPTAVVGEKTAHPPIMVRQTAAGIEYLRIDRPGLELPENPGRKAFESKDLASAVHVLNRHKSKGMGLVCYGPAQTLGAALRGSLVSDCLQLDLTEGGQAAGPGPTALALAPVLPRILQIAANRQMALWLRAQGSMAPGQCEQLARSVEEMKAKPRSVMVEFPAAALPETAALESCAQAFAKAGIMLSYRVPVEPARGCAEALALGKSFNDTEMCLSFRRKLAAVRDSRLFADIVFEYPSIQAIEHADRDRHFSWNLVQVQAGDYFDISPERFRMVVPDGNDPNSPRPVNATPHWSRMRPSEGEPRLVRAAAAVE
ncbi:phosphoethanolamine transferase [Azohydromonas caseinilytica]|uniref:Phosphoethanolamine transferase n=1 Tax=Azohydromonas caseinilytica TaxID=2728836 RepID=A0A848FDT8_9BURK|nr:phosphoethanolamine transferase [Azohydromonas caseinilytica]NML17614.1 phosphoethanolamine transferase [Azohydromonas caseinilytica]